jgi:hypothetical protein
VDQTAVHHQLINKIFNLNKKPGQSTEEEDERVRNEKIRFTINFMRTYRLDLAQAREHECEQSYCEPLNAVDIVRRFEWMYGQRMFGEFNNDVYLCRYGKVHICSEYCTPEDGTSCPITGRCASVIYSQFVTDGDEVMVGDAPTSAYYKTFINCRRLAQEQDFVWNRENPVYGAERQQVDAAAAAGANGDKPVVAKVKKRRHGGKKYKRETKRRSKTTTVVKGSNASKTTVVVGGKRKKKSGGNGTGSCSERTEQLGRDHGSIVYWYDLFFMNRLIPSKSGEGACFLFNMSRHQVFADITLEQYLVSTGQISVSNAIKASASIGSSKFQRDHVELIQVAEDIMRKILPGIHRLETEGDEIETAQLHRFSLCIRYIESCIQEGIIPCFPTALRLYYLDLEDVFGVLGCWVSWEQWLQYLTIIVQWWDLCKEVIDLFPDTPNHTLDYTQHVLACIYCMENGMSYEKEINGITISLPLIPVDENISMQDYVVRLNLLSRYGIEKPMFNNGLKTLRSCIALLTRCKSISELLHLL